MASHGEGAELVEGDAGRPEMSVVLITLDGYESLREVVGHLRRQTVREQLEIVVVAPTRAELAPIPAELGGFMGLRVVEVGRIHSTGAARAAGFREASAAVVAYVEEHSYPEPRWAEALIQAHRKEVAAVGATLLNANPRGLISWVAFFLDFGPAVERTESPLGASPAAHHTSYKRELLLDYGASLESLLEAEAMLCEELRRSDHELRLEPRARQYHVNPSRLRPFLRSQFLGGRVYGALRKDHTAWSALRRSLYVAAGPLILLVQLHRVLGEIHRTGRHRDLLPRALPLLVLGLTAVRLGETLGYAFGPGNAGRQRVSIELQRHLHVSRHDRAAGAAGADGAALGGAHS